MPPQPLSLTPDEAAALQAALAGDSPAVQRRAQIIILSAESVPVARIAAAVGLSERQVRRWQHAFRQHRLAILMPPRSNPQPGSPSPEQPRLPLRLDKKPGITPEDPMSEAGRKTLYFHFERMLLHEPGSRLGEDIEAVHDMRVATRRMRSALRIFAPFYRRQAIRPFQRALGDTARALGAVRDMDVFLDRLLRYRAGLPAGAGDSLAPLLDYCAAEREAARARLIDHLNSPAFAGFVESFAAFLTTPGAGARDIDPESPATHLTGYLAPALIYARYEAVRAYEPVLVSATIETLHALRIEFKRLRYTLEFFAEILGPEAALVIDEVKTMQDHLGDLNDAHLAGRFLQDFIARYETAQAALPISERRSIEQVAGYLAHQLAEKHRLLSLVPAAWEHFSRDEVRQALAQAIVALSPAANARVAATPASPPQGESGSGAGAERSVARPAGSSPG